MYVCRYVKKILSVQKWAPPRPPPSQAGLSFPKVESSNPNAVRDFFSFSVWPHFLFRAIILDIYTEIHHNT